MPSEYECRSRLLKQNPMKPTQRRGEPNVKHPGPDEYEPPQIFCGKGYSKIKRAPAYTFGLNIPVSCNKPATTPFAKLFDVGGMGAKGPFRIKYSVVSPRIEPLRDRTKKPGPATYAPRALNKSKRPPAFSISQKAKPPYQPWDQWTPPPNIYWPPIQSKKPPAYSFGYPARRLKPPNFPGPGDHHPNFQFVEKTIPAFSLKGAPKEPRLEKRADPYNHCEKKFNVKYRTAPAPSFGIKHSQYLGVQPAYIKSSKLDLTET